MKQKSILRFFHYAILCVGVLLIIFPLYMTIITPFKTPAENTASFFTFPSSFYLENFKTILTSERYYRAFLNTVYATVCTLLGCLCVMPMMGYAISRSMDHSKIYKGIYFFVLLGIFIPFQVKMMPLVKLMGSFRFMNIPGFVILAIACTTSESIFLYVGFLNSIPKDMEEAACIDGASTNQTFQRIVFPLMTPIISTIMIKDGLWMWNDFMMPLVILNRSWKQWTLTLFQYNFKTEYTTDYGLSFATLVLSMLPIMIFYSFMQKNLISGLTTGALKS
jgi:raffinose/stachyose/melibiose transport system permease protein